MNSNTGNDRITLADPLPISITVPELSLPIDREARKANHATIEERFEAAMQRRREFIERFEKDTGVELDANRRDSVAEIEWPETLAKANHGALKLLLEAWYERLGLQDSGWTRYNEKTTARACRTIRQILDNGDEELGIPIEALEGKESWIKMIDSIKWWFFNLSGAFDFLSVHGIGPEKFGSGLVRVEILNYARQGRCLFGIDHNIALLAWREAEVRMVPTRYPPMHPCGCHEYRLLMKTIGNFKGFPAAAEERTLTRVGDLITDEWLANNRDAAFDVNGWPTSAEAQNPVTVTMGDEKTLEMRYYKGNDITKGINLRAVRAEGYFAELL